MSESIEKVTETYKMTIGETVATLQKYDKQAEDTLAKLQASIDNAEKILNEWRKQQLMIVGQRQLLKDLISQTTQAEQPSK